MARVCPGGNPHPVSATAARSLAENHNAALRKALGLDRKPAGTSSLHWTPHVTPSGAGLSIVGRF